MFDAVVLIINFSVGYLFRLLCIYLFMFILLSFFCLNISVSYFHEYC